MFGVAGSCALGSLYATQIEPSWIDITKLDIPMLGLPEALDGLTIAQLSDFHLGPYVPIEDVRHSVEVANNLAADLIVITGDFVYQSASYSAACCEELAALNTRYGVFAVLGNHDVWTDPEIVVSNLSSAGIDLIRNDIRRLGPENQNLWLLGVEDKGETGGSFSEFKSIWQTTADNLGVLLEEIPADEPRLLLVHNPDFTEMLPEKRIDLTLCGHSHGGQVRLPFFGAPIVPSFFGQKYVSGLVHGPVTKVYINRGIGLIPPPVRINSRPEITVFHLWRV
jgi:predicted MPP superfamily phosphohydrolase